jgi:hypothetical protein
MLNPTNAFCAHHVPLCPTSWDGGAPYARERQKHFSE